jgi:hypothetical protein
MTDKKLTPNKSSDKTLKSKTNSGTGKDQNKSGQPDAGGRGQAEETRSKGSAKK